jgi:cation diffusion facilitator CzcD-associated flavoprotein CzcO
MKNKNRPLDVLIIGAGFGGICAAIKLKQTGIENFRVIEKDAEVGGTWWSNTYPGAACDVPSHFYCYSFAPNPNWSRKYSPQAEIQKYIKNCADKFDVTRFISHGLKVVRLVLNERSGIWTVHLDDGSELSARHIINGMGGLHKPSIPDFKGLKKFKGPTMHSAEWNHDVDFKDKKVAMIGSAASAIQIIPELAKICDRVDVYQRTPNYIAPRNDRDFTDKEKKRFDRWPWFTKLYRWFIYKRMDVLVYPLTKQKSRFSSKATKGIMDWMRSVLPDPEMQEKMVPNYTIGCKRILLSDNFYATMTKDNVNLISSGIAEIAATGIKAVDGELHEADIITFATGFDIQGHMASIDIVGSGGVSMADLGPDSEEAFKGAVHFNFPNYYMITGPNTGVGTTSVVYMIELQVDYILQLIKAAGDDKLISVKPEALRAYNLKIHDELSRSVWASGCDSWYLRDDGKITTLYPGSAKDFAKAHKRINLQNYNVLEVSR